ncbi:MAG: two-component system response regulator CreB [Saccharospirillaceae bacterium]|nr:two-component system response regulator CreB [Saccharospirillaceae bacterium]
MLKQTILIVDDEPSISQTLEYALQLDSFNTLSCEFGKQALDILQKQSIDFIVLDVGLPDINGFELCKKIRQFSNIPILFLTARNDEFDRILGLEIGADDYVCKPFSPREVSTRIKVILKRLQSNLPTVQTTPRLKSNLQIDLSKASVIYYDQVLALTKFEYQLLTLMHQRPDQVFSRTQLMDAIWPNSASLERSVDTHIKSLRAKLKNNYAQSNTIKTHRGLGYSVNSKNN